MKYKAIPRVDGIPEDVNFRHPVLSLIRTRLNAHFRSSVHTAADPCSFATKTCKDRRDAVDPIDVYRNRTLFHRVPLAFSYRERAEEREPEESMSGG